ncbi:membrane protein [Kitasatospora sp. NE20-6]|uniref:PH domain-containing protein n=1 Tax=Kitasatospora sp. NE20-6 TaxID=2859066 RepID=UPI0034DCBA93
MTESDGTPDPGSAAPQEPKYADRVYRSGPGIISGVLLLAVAGWLIVDAVISGSGRTPWVALAAAPVFAFPVIAYTLRPAVYANDRRLLVRNPLRTIDAPWSGVEGLKSGYSVELFAAGHKYQVWAVPVSIRQRKTARRRADRARAAGDPGLTRRPGDSDPTRAWSDQVVDELQEMASHRSAHAAAQGPVVVRWCWWVIAPTVLGLIALVALIVTG